MQNDRLQQVNSAALSFLEPINLEQTYQTVTHQALKLFDGFEGFILLAEGNTSNLKKAYSTSNRDLTELLKSDEAYTSFKKKKSIVTDKEIYIPLFYQKKSFGTLLICLEEKGTVTEEDVEVLKVFGSLATLAIRKAQLYKEHQNSLKVRDLFISMATHELKTPLTSISGYVQLLHSKMKDKSGPEAGWIDTLLYETKRLNDLINEMMRSYSIKSGKLAFTWKECSLSEVINKSVATFSAAEAQRKVEFINLVEEGTDSVIGDCMKLEQVIDNLLDNADKFSDKKEPIRIELYNDGTFLAIEIIDKGSGIPKEELPHVFDEFYKGKTNQTLSGLGLGLFFVKTIIHQHHGKIHISSTKKGTRVIIRFKRATL